MALLLSWRFQHHSADHLLFRILSRANLFPNDGKYPINCHLHNWPSASVKSIKEAYSWFYQLWAPLEADAQHCRRIACFGVSGVWLCADSLDYQKPNSVKIADKMNELLDGDNGCLDKGDSSMVQGQVSPGISRHPPCQLRFP